ncbi:hypothetical protein AGDE_02899 [Angomonas deanei]|nr:hypothetical protein AGDE_05232 [Angomonas deanei]EPY41026.1 hypothetical protein AGDE_02899 [Angomonas deanei]|eukprot:EPY38697.1 hypothetical protein AGDE_05232 [Angomonas deanei]
MSDKALKHLGSEDYEPTSALKTLSTQLHCGYLIESDLFRQYFVNDDNELIDGQLHSAQKALSALARKALLAIKMDASGTVENTFGTDQYTSLKDEFARLLEKGKVDVNDTQALAAPQIQKRGERKAKRGGKKEQQKRHANDGSSLLERALSRVKMGVSEEEQREEILQRDDIRIQLRKEQEKTAQNGRKRGRTEEVDEYNDLLSLDF